MSSKVNSAKPLGLGPADPHSFSNPGEVQVTNYGISWDVDFTKQIISGRVVYDLKRSAKAHTKLILDTRDLTIKSVFNARTNAKLKFTIGDNVLTFGKPLSIIIPSGDMTPQIGIEYETSPSCSALQWRTKEQTTDKTHPFLSSHGQPIHTRSLLPCQDTPSQKSTFSSEVVTDDDFTVLMSGLSDKVQTIGTNSDKAYFKFTQKIPIPTYLIAIAVGKLTSREIGPRSKVWGESSIIDDAAFDFSDTESFIKIGEALLGEYVWTQYDILVLPSEEAFGGMENPCITFTTPTLLSGDKSLAYVIAHEVGHSWTGNLVTCSNHEHFWLNEGFTMYLERRIIGASFGEPFRHFHCIEGLNHLNYSISIMENKNFTKLVPSLTGIDPEDAFSNIPYEKGFIFLFYLEQLVGIEKFDAFLKYYVNINKYKSISSTTFKEQFLDFFNKKTAPNKLKQIDWDDWFYAEGMPKIIPSFDTSLCDPCYELKDKWLSWDPKKSPTVPFSMKDLIKFTFRSDQAKLFLAELVEEIEGKGIKFDLEKTKAMSKVYKFDGTKNCEIKSRWYKLCLLSHWEEKVKDVCSFVTSQGRLLYNEPLYRAMYNWEYSKPIAIKTFLEHRSLMCPYGVNVIESVLGLKPKKNLCQCKEKKAIQNSK